MSATPTNLKPEQQRRAAQMSLGVDYTPTEEEKRVLKECNEESFIYRSVPLSVISMAVTKVLLSRGILSASPRFGSLPKMAFAGLCGYMAGKLSYMKTCQEKLKKLENSPVGEILRQRAGMSPHHSSRGAQSELNDPNASSFDTMFQPAEAPNTTSSLRDYGYDPDPPFQMDRADDFSAPAQLYVEEEEEPRKKSILYEDLRLRNRENYEVTLTQKDDTVVKAPLEKEAERPKKQGKKNIYGDTWEE